MSDKSAHKIVFGNEKGGTGKSTLAMHVAIDLAQRGNRVAVLDLDSRQQSTARFIENRERFLKSHDYDLAMPAIRTLHRSTATDKAQQQAEDQRTLQQALEAFDSSSDFIVFDCPGSYTYLSRLAHALANTLVTPINDSFIDLDLIGQVDPDSYTVEKLSHYAEVVWESRKFRSASEKDPIDWVIARNRLATLDSLNNRRVDAALASLQKRIMFRYVPGLNERVIFRELFPKGLTMMDLGTVKEFGKLQVSHVAARSEVRALVNALNLPDSREKAA